PQVGTKGPIVTPGSGQPNQAPRTSPGAHGVRHGQAERYGSRLMARPSETPPREPAQRPPFRAFVRYFLGLGAWGFGGPIATVGYMQRDLVERRGWLERQGFLNGVALGETLPGTRAAQGG